MTGIIIVNKEQNFTSFDVVAVMRKIVGTKKVGHTGTLDPMATGVLPILVGRATKACDILPNSDKSYTAKFAIGQKTDTGDVWGKVIESSDKSVSEEEILEKLPNFTGEIMQVPPMYSAVSVNGKRLYEYARQGIEVEREARPITVSELSLTDFDGKTGTLKITCSKGTYIRTLIEDIAESVGAVATMTALERTNACGFDIAQAYTLDELKSMKESGELDKVVIDTEQIFSEYPVLKVSEAQAKRFANGGALELGRTKIEKDYIKDKNILRVYFDGFIALGIIDIDTNSIKYMKSFN